MNSITIDEQTFTVDDDLGCLQMMSSAFLALVAEGKVDIQQLASGVLANRGQDSTGRWVGFPAAKALHQSRGARVAA